MRVNATAETKRGGRRKKGKKKKEKKRKEKKRNETERNEERKERRGKKVEGGTIEAGARDSHGPGQTITADYRLHVEQHDARLRSTIDHVSGLLASRIPIVLIYLC